MCFVVTVFTLSNIESNKSKCCLALPGAWVPANAGTHAEPLLYMYIVYIMFLFFEGTGIWSGVAFVSVSIWVSRNWNFSVKSIRSIAVFGGRLQRPSLCLIRSAPRRQRGWGLSETSEKCVFFLFWAVYARAILGSWHMQSLNE